MAEIPPSIIPKGKERLCRLIDIEYPWLTSVFHYTHNTFRWSLSCWKACMNQCFLNVQDIKLWRQIIIIQILTTVHNTKIVFVYNNKLSASISVTIKAQTKDEISKSTFSQWKFYFFNMIFAIMQDSFMPKSSSSSHFVGKWNSLFPTIQLVICRFDSSGLPHTEQMNL